MHSTSPQTAERDALSSSVCSLSRRAQIAMSLLISVAALSGCQSMSMNSAQLRMIDVSSNTGPIDSYQDSAALAYNLSYGTVTSYVASAAGTSALTLDKAGTRQTLVTAKGTLSPGKQYTEIVTGSLVDMHETVLTDQASPAPAGQIAVRIINEAANAGAVDVYLVPSRTRLSGLSPIAANLAVGENPGYRSFPEGTYSIDVLPAGGSPSSADQLLSGAEVQYPSGAVRTVVLIDRHASNGDSQTKLPSVQAITADDADAP